MARGATSTTVRRSVLRESALLASIGLPVGLGLAWAAGRVLASGMDGIAIPQASSYAVVTLILARGPPGDVEPRGAGHAGRPGPCSTDRLGGFGRALRARGLV